MCIQTPTFEQRTGPYIHVQGLGYSPFDMVSPHHPPDESDTKYVTVFAKGMSRLLRCCMSSGTLSLLRNRSPDFSLH
jgi:hypothetical protein